MENIRLITARGERESLSNLWYASYADMMQIYDAVEDSKTASEIIDNLNQLKLLRKFSFHKETAKEIRLKGIDTMGNISYLIISKSMMSSNDAAAEILPGMKYDIVLLEKEGVTGLKKEEVMKLMDHIQGEEVYPLEFPSKTHDCVAMGFITPEAANKLDFIYSNGSKIHDFIASILDDMELESENHTYSYQGLSIWLNR